MSTESPTVPSIPRRHDLDALRALAMLAGILLHSLISFTVTPGPWPVVDVRQHVGFDVLMAALHGFRMQLFFLISGFFTAMLWRKRGLNKLIAHRLKRIALPLLIGMFTIIPAVWAAAIGVGIMGGNTGQKNPGDSLASAALYGTVEQLQSFIKDDTNLDEFDPTFKSTPLSLACLNGDSEMVKFLLEKGASLNARNEDGTTALHGAAFFGRADCARVLVDAGAEIDAINHRGDKVWDTLQAPWMITNGVAGLLRIELDQNELKRGRQEILVMLKEAVEKREAEIREREKEGAAFTDKGDAKDQAALSKEKKAGGLKEIVGLFILLGTLPVFHHLWFLWFLCWLVAAFVVYANLMEKKKWSLDWITSPRRYLWLIPLTLAPQCLMGKLYPVFGPDTSPGLVPFPHLLFYYAIFFFFGAMYFDCDDKEGRLGRNWKLTIPIALLVIFPLSFEVTLGKLGFADRIPEDLHRPISVVTQVIYTWLMTFGMIGLFRDLFASRSKTMRYISDSSYWLYVAHMPVIFLAQFWVRNWELPAVIKCAIVCTVTTVSLLISYQVFVRYTPIGTLLNGPRKRAGNQEPVVIATVVEP